MTVHLCTPASRKMTQSQATHCQIPILVKVFSCKCFLGTSSAPSTCSCTCAWSTYFSLFLLLLIHGRQQLIEKSREHATGFCFHWGWHSKEMLAYLVQILQILRVSLNCQLVLLTKY